MFPGVRSSAVFLGFGLKPPASGFQSDSYSSLKTSPSVPSKVVPSVLASFFAGLFSVSFLPIHKAVMVVTFLGSLVQSCYRERGTLQTNNTGMCWQCLGHTGFAPTHGVCVFPVYTARAIGCSSGNSQRWALGCMHFPGLSLSGLGT